MSTVLVVDDCPVTCRMMSKLITVLGHEGVCRTGGVEALEYLQTHSVDLVILDLMMPDIDGMEVLRRLRHEAATAKVPVVMFSAMSEPAVVKRAMESGANDYWVKSRLDFQQLSGQVERWASRPA